MTNAAIHHAALLSLKTNALHQVTAFNNCNVKFAVLYRHPKSRWFLIHRSLSFSDNNFSFISHSSSGRHRYTTPDRFFSNSIVPHLYLIKSKSMEFSSIDLSGIVQNFVVGNHIHNLPQHPQTIGLWDYISTTSHSNVSGYSVITGASTRSLLTAWSPVRSKLSAILLELPIPKKHILSAYQFREQPRQTLFRLEDWILFCVRPPDSAQPYLRRKFSPSHHHHINRIIFVVDTDHVSRHRKQVRLDAQILWHYHWLLSRVSKTPVVLTLLFHDKSIWDQSVVFC